MDILSLVKDFGIPFAILIAAIIALWKAFQVERKLRDEKQNQEAKRYRELLENREEELHELYKKRALKNLHDLVEKGKKKNGK